MFTQFKSMVASAVTQDPIYEYKVDQGSSRQVGRGRVFRVRDAVEISSGKEVSIFQIKVSDMATRDVSAAEKEDFLARVRASVALLSQLRHPGVLRVERGLVEVPGKKLWFVTERVREWVPDLPLKELPRQVRVLALRRCAETLRFLHETADVLAVDFSPNSLFVAAADGRWKLADLGHAVRRAALVEDAEAAARSLLPPSSSSSSSGFAALGAPLIDYAAAEFVDGVLRRGGGAAAPAAAFDGLLPDGGGALAFPDTDVYSFLLTTVEVLNGGRRLFLTDGSAEKHRAQRASVSAEVEKFFPTGALTRRPRPPISTVMATGPFATPDMQVLGKVERYDTLDPSDRFALLKTLYTMLGAPTTTTTSSSRPTAGDDDSGGFCETVVVENILPLMKRESKQQSMLRFVVPIMLQCSRVLSRATFDAHLREYFVALLNAMVKAQPPWYEKVGLLAQLVLEKFDLLRPHFSSSGDRVAVLMPFLTKCLYCDATGGEALLSCALSCIRDLFAEAGKSVGSLLPTHDGAVALAQRLVEVGTAHRGLFSTAFLCLETVLEGASMATKQATEQRLVRALESWDTAASSPSSSSMPSASYSNGGGGDGGGFPGLTASDDPQTLQLQCVMDTLRRLEGGFSREHIATTSIPRLAPLLLSPVTAIRQFAAQAIEAHMALFLDGARAAGNNNTNNKGSSSGINISGGLSAPHRYPQHHEQSAVVPPVRQQLNSSSAASLFPPPPPPASSSSSATAAAPQPAAVHSSSFPLAPSPSPFAPQQQQPYNSNTSWQAGGSAVGMPPMGGGPAPAWAPNATMMGAPAPSGGGGGGGGGAIGQQDDILSALGFS